MMNSHGCKKEDDSGRHIIKKGLVTDDILHDANTNLLVYESLQIIIPIYSLKR